jgi:hypothetical protein
MDRTWCTSACMQGLPRNRRPGAARGGARADRLAVLDAQAYDGRQLELEPYRRRATASACEAAAHYELALMIWFQHYTGAPAPCSTRSPLLRRALERSPRAHAVHWAAGKVLLQSGRSAEAAQAFQEAARAGPATRGISTARAWPSKAGDAAAARRAGGRPAVAARLKNRLHARLQPARRLPLRVAQRGDAAANRREDRALLDREP